jgi:hypothetical protein
MFALGRRLCTKLIANLLGLREDSTALIALIYLFTTINFYTAAALNWKGLNQNLLPIHLQIFAVSLFCHQI